MAQTRVGGGQALDNNLEKLSNGINPKVPVNVGAFGNAIVTGNVSGLSAFQGKITYRSPGDLYVKLGSGDLFNFDARSLGSTEWRSQLGLADPSQWGGLTKRWGGGKWGPSQQLIRPGSDMMVVQSIRALDSGAVTGQGLEMGRALPQMSGNFSPSAVWRRQYQYNQAWENFISPPEYQMQYRAGEALQVPDPNFLATRRHRAWTPAGKTRSLYQADQSAIDQYQQDVDPVIEPKNIDPQTDLQTGEPTGDTRKDDRKDERLDKTVDRRVQRRVDERVGRRLDEPIDAEIDPDTPEALASGRGSESASPETADQAGRPLPDAMAQSRWGADDTLGRPGDPDQAEPGSDDVSTESQTGSRALRHGKGQTFAKLMADGRQAMADGRYYSAEEQFDLATRVDPSSIEAERAMIDAQLGAGLFYVASQRLRRLYRRHPEQVTVRSPAALMPSADRLQEVDRQMRRQMQRRPSRVANLAMLIGYIGVYQRDLAQVQWALATWRRRRPDDPMLSIVAAQWQQAAEQASSSTSQPAGTGE